MGRKDKMNKIIQEMFEHEKSLKELDPVTLVELYESKDLTSRIFSLIEEEVIRRIIRCP